LAAFFGPLKFDFGPRPRSKCKDSRSRSGRSPDWLKMKNSDAPAMKREAEEDWAR
jgi:hypothetical protein